MGSIETGQYINTHTFQSPISQIWMVWCYEGKFLTILCQEAQLYVVTPGPSRIQIVQPKPKGEGRGDVSWRPTNVSRLLMPAAVTSLISGFSSRLWGDSPPWYRGAPLTFGGILGDTFANTQNFYLIHFPHSHSEHITRYCDIQTGEKCSNNWVKNVPSARYSHLRTVSPDRGPVNSKWVGEPG